MQWTNGNKIKYTIHWIVIYPVDRVIHTLNNQAQAFKYGPLYRRLLHSNASRFLLTKWLHRLKEVSAQHRFVLK